MDTVVFVVCILIIVIVLIFQRKSLAKDFGKIITLSDERKSYMDMKFEEVDSIISNIKIQISKDIELIDADLKKSDLRFDDIDNQINNIKDLIEKVKIESNKNSENIKSDFSQQIENINDTILVLLDSTKTILEENKRLRKQLEFYTEIKSDSLNLNESSDIDVQEQLLKNALHQLAENKKEVQEKPKSEFIVEVRNQIDSPIGTISSDESTQESTKTIHETVNANNENMHLSVLDEEQKAAFELMLNTKQNIFITGKAGTGKSFLLKLFVKATSKRTILLAPTGIAAINIQGATIHSAFGYDNLVKLSIDDINLSTIKLKSEKRQLLKIVDVIIIDEISMIRSDTFEKIDKILKVLNNNTAAFGGKQIIVFGDLFQLPPIAKANEIKYLQDTFGGIYFFYSRAYSQANFKFVELSINHRQKEDSSFFEILNKIREGNILKDDLTILNSRTTFDNEQLRRTIRLFPTKAEAESVNRRELEKISAKEYEFQSKLLYSKNNITQNLDNMFPVSDILKLKLGALVMLVVNDAQKRWVNGTLGIISEISNETIKITVDGCEYEIVPTEFSQQEATYQNGVISYETICTIEQYPIVLAYAITIHKSQGMTYKRLACDVSDCFAPGQAYVALSRCSSLDGLYLLNKVEGNILSVETDIKDFYLKQKKAVY